MLMPALAASAALVSAGYQSMAKKGQWFGRAFCGLRRGSKEIALTFDDGPNDPHTPHLLDVLDRYDVRATFFLIGRYVRQRPDIAQDIARRGHVIGNHTFSHPLLIFAGSAEARQEIMECRNAIQDAVGEHSNLFRPPWGGRGPGLFRRVRELGLEPVMWSVTGYDWNAPSAEFIERKVRARIRGGDVVLLHDGGHAQFGVNRAFTVQAAQMLISRYKAEGYVFVTIPQMIAASKLSSPAVAR